MLNHYSKHYPPNEKMLKIVIWHILFNIWPKEKNKSEIKPPVLKLAMLEAAEALVASKVPQEVLLLLNVSLSAPQAVEAAAGVAAPVALLV